MESRLMIAKLFVPVFIAAAALPGCHSRPGKPGGDSVKIVSVPEVAHFVEEKSAVIYDANGAETRQKYGVVPGAILLTNHKDYPLSELPPEKSKQLVFYCGGTACRASDTAAERAAGAGYTNVSVMREGIKGWATAGQKTVPQS
jgi:rhodanese-related sulfurtransferase